MSPLDTKQPIPPGTPTPAGPPPKQEVVKFTKEQAADRSMTTLFGGGYGQYQVRPENFLLSVVTHTVVVLLILWLFHITIQPRILPPSMTNQSVDLTPYVPLKVGKHGISGGGGGDASKLKASTGTPPRAAKEQFAPPVVVQTQKSKLMVEPTVVADLKYTSTTQIGDPLSKLMTPSNGVGVGGGIGSGNGGGVGSGHGGPGVGPGLFHVGDGVSAPKPIFTPEPEFSEEARKAKFQGAVILSIVILPDGTTTNIRVTRPLGLGLDEKAIEAVRKWRFRPSMKDGKAVAVSANVEVNFRLL